MHGIVQYQHLSFNAIFSVDFATLNALKLQADTFPHFVLHLELI